MMLTTIELRQTSADGGHISGYPEKKAWDCGCRRHLKAGSEEVLIARVIHHLNVQHPEAHPTLEQAAELVAAEAYDEPHREKRAEDWQEGLVRQRAQERAFRLVAP